MHDVPVVWHEDMRGDSVSRGSRKRQKLAELIHYTMEQTGARELQGTSAQISSMLKQMCNMENIRPPSWLDQRTLPKMLGIIDSEPEHGLECTRLNTTRPVYWRITPRPSERGVLVTFEGVDGVGKSTVCRHVFSMLKSSGLEVYACKEPRYLTSKAADALNSLLDLPPDELKAIRELVFVGDRVLHQFELERMLDAYDVVLVDRYMHSQLAYATAHGSPLVEQLRAWSTTLLQPHLNVLIRAPISVVVERKAGDPVFLKRVDYAYSSYANMFNTYVVDGTQPPRQIAAQVSKRVCSLLSCNSEVSEKCRV